MKDIKTEELIIHVGEKEIYGRLWLPVTEGKCPAVICSHGYNGTHSGCETECRAFAQQGYIVYSYDFCGGSTRSRSTGKSTDMTLFTEKQDLLDVFDHIAALEQVDENAIFLQGGSQGGIVTALAAEERADQVRGMILYCPAYNIPDDWRNRFGAVENIPETFEFWELTLGKNFFVSMKDFVTYDHVGGFKGPVLILQGELDQVVTPAAAKRASEQYANAELILLPGEGHGFSEAGRKLAIEKALQMMQSSLQKTTESGK